MNSEWRYKRRDLWDMTRSALEVERRRLRDGVDTSEVIQGTTTDSYYFRCPGDAHEVRTRAKEAITIVNNISLEAPWPSEEEWVLILPDWFVEACAPNGTRYEDWKGDDTLTIEERRALFFAEKWKLSWWVSWMEPEDRRWLWLDAEVLDADTLLVHVDRVGDPCDLGEPPGVWWLFAASGATEFDEVGISDDIYRIRIQQRPRIV